MLDAHFQTRHAVVGYLTVGRMEKSGANKWLTDIIEHPAFRKSRLQHEG